MPDEPQVSEAEWQVMNVVWEKAPIGAAEVIEALAESTGWRPTTVRTLLARLVKKKFLLYRRDGNRFLYRPKVKKEECVRRASRSFVDQFFGGDAMPLVLHFVEEGRLGKREMEEIRKLLDEAEARGE